MFADDPPPAPPTPSHMPALIIPANCATPPAILTCFLNSIVIFTRPLETKLTDTTTTETHALNTPASDEISPL